MKKNIMFWAVCAAAFIAWKIIFSTDTAKDTLRAIVVPNDELNAAQIKQIEDIAGNIAAQSNANKQAMLDDMTGRRQKLSATPDLFGRVLPCLITNSALKNAPTSRSVCCAV